MWNAAFSVGGPACTIRQFEQLTKVKIDHFVVLDFNGFKDMVDAIDGVKVCIPEDVDDPVGNIHLEGRHPRGEGPGGPQLRARAAQHLQQRRHRPDEAPAGVHRRDDQQGEVGRHPRATRPRVQVRRRRHQLADPRPGPSSVKKIADLAGQFQDIGLSEVKFITVPFDSYEPDPNRLVWTEDANELWKKVRFDQPLSKRLSADVITAAEKPGAKATPSAPTRPSDSAAPTEADAEKAAANGLCA